MSRKISWIVTCAAIVMIAATPLLACSESCLDEYPCNVPADDYDAAHDAGSGDGGALFDAAPFDAGFDAGSLTDGALDDAERLDANGDADAGSDAADD